MMTLMCLWIAHIPELHTVTRWCVLYVSQMDQMNDFLNRIVLALM